MIDYNGLITPHSDEYIDSSKMVEAVIEEYLDKKFGGLSEEEILVVLRSYYPENFL